MGEIRETQKREAKKKTLDSTYEGPSVERDQAIEDSYRNPDKPWIRPNDASAYAEQDLQKEASDNLTSMGDRYATDRTASVDRARLETALPAGTNPTMQQATQIGGMVDYDAARTGNVDPTSRATVRGPTGYTPQTAGAANTIGSVAISPLSGAKAVGVDGATINRGEDQEVRDIQAEQARRLNDAALGTGPSMVNPVLQNGIEKSLAAQVAGAASTRGSSPVGGVNRSLRNNAAVAQADARGKAVVANIQERQAAEQQLAGVTGQQRGQDIAVNQGQAQLDDARNRQASAQAQQTELANEAQRLQVALKNGDMTMEQYQFNAAQLNQRQLENATILNEAGRFIADATNRVNEQQAGIDQSANSQTSSQTFAAQMQNAQFEQQRRKDYFDAVNNRTMSQAQLDQRKAELDMAAENQFKQLKLDRDTTMKLAQFDADTRLNLADLEAELRLKGMDDQMRAYVMSQEIAYANQIAGQGMAYDQAAVARTIARHQAGQGPSDFQQFMQTASPFIQGAAMVGGTLLAGPAGGTAAGAATSAATSPLFADSGRAPF